MLDTVDAALGRIEEAQCTSLRANNDVTPLGFLKAIYCNENTPLPVHMRAAVEAASYVHATYKATALIVNGGDFAARLERAIESSRGADQLLSKVPDVEKLRGG
jgi:hypothetical protein